MSTHDTLNIALVGCGNIGANGHAPAYAILPGLRLAAVCDLLPERAQALAQETGAQAYSDYRSLLERPDIHMVDLCVPTFMHARLAIEALHAGKHVLVEKPIAATLEEADAMIATARESGRSMMVAHVRRFDHRYREIKAAIDQGEVGRPVYIRRAERQRLPFPSEAWFWQPDLGGGVILDIGVHIADLFCWYYGARPESVYAIGRAVGATARQSRTYDHALITCRFPGGALGQAEASWAYPPAFGAGFYASLEVVGTEGKISYNDPDSNPMQVFDVESDLHLPRYFRFMSTTEYAFQEEIAQFTSCIRDGNPPPLSLQEARTALEICLAAQVSAVTGEPVRLPLQEGQYD
jgi:UDP-N-acetylglucosamine 3-dehydrogenase